MCTKGEKQAFFTYISEIEGVGTKIVFYILCEVFILARIESKTSNE